MNKKYDVGILGWWYGQNYGSMLTYYALNTVVKKLGYSPIMIHEALGYNGWRVNWPKDIEPMNFARRQGYEFTEQQHFSENPRLNELADTFMVGSDQLWNPNVGRVNDDLFLDFTNDDAKRIAYATSFGNANTKKFTPEFIQKHSQNLKRFDSLSVREKYGVDTAKNIFGVDVDQVLDPVFLLDKSDFSKLSEGATTRPEGDYLLSFILDPSPEKKSVIINIAKKLKLTKVVVLTDADEKSIKRAQELFSEEMFQVISEVKPENWLYAYENSKYVVTDSFHGSCFSFIFQKPFSVFFNTTRGADRFVNLMNLFEIGDERRIYENYSQEDVDRNAKISYEIDYSAGNAKVATESKRSFEWLRSAFNEPKKTEKILPKGEIKIKEKKVTSTAKKSDIAVPTNTPSREQIVLNILNDEKVKKWKSDLLTINNKLNLFVGRELKEYTHNKVGGPADILVFPKIIEDIESIVEYAIKNNIAYTVLGKGSNVIVRDGGIRGIVIITSDINYSCLENNHFTAGAGASLIDATYYLLERSKSGLEWAVGIPGTIGGAVYMNAGTNISDVRSCIKSVKYLNEYGKVAELQKEDIEWGKRFTTFMEHKKWIILEATFNTKSSNSDEDAKKMIKTTQTRENHFPLEYPNHGSTFKWWRAPRLIKQAGLAGTKLGGVKISDKQPGFFINFKQATAADYEALINLTIAKVYQFSGFLLEPEVEIIGERLHRYERYTLDSITTNLERKEK